MDKYSVLLVDDEQEVIDIIRQKIDWEEIGFNVIGSAENGVKALELAEKYQPDVVITDIKMPFMDGLELSRRLKKDLPNTRIMLFTGFDEFEYAKEAIHLEIEDYLLKPINAKELIEALSKLKNTLDQEKEERLNIKKLENYYMDSLPLLQINFFVSLIEGRIREDNLEQYMSDYKINLNGPFYTVVAFHTSTHRIPENMTPLLLSMSVQQQVKDVLGTNWRGEIFTYLGNTVMIAELKNHEEAASLTDACDHFAKWAGRVMGAVVTAGIGRTCAKLTELELSYEGAREAVSYRVLYGTNRAINIAEIAPQEEKFSTDAEEDFLHDLFKAIHVGDKEKIEESVEREVENVHKMALTVNQYHLTIMEMVGAWYRFSANNFLNFDDFKGNVKDPYREVNEMDEGTLKKWLMGVSFSLSETLKNARNNSSRSIIAKAKEFVHDRYTDPDLSLDVVCAELGVSNSYFSTIFKKETGHSFIAYLTDYRMRRAAERIIETTEKNYEIAEHVGYLDANYFSYVFKKAYGMSPSRYRTTHIGK